MTVVVEISLMLWNHDLERPLDGSPMPGPETRPSADADPDNVWPTNVLYLKDSYRFQNLETRRRVEGLFPKHQRFGRSHVPDTELKIMMIELTL